MANKRNPTAFLKEEYDTIVANGFDWKLKVLEGPSTPRARVNGKEVIVLCSNNYLNLSTHPRMKEAAKRAIDSHGVGSGSVRPIAGNMDLHEELERRVARFKRFEAALSFTTGFATNSGILSQVADKGDLVISDELNHGSIIDGIRLNKAERGIYKHNDMADLERVLKEADAKGDAKGYRRILITTDGVFSMDGDLALLPDIVRLANEFGAMVYVDDAHGEGVMGEGGRGVSSHYHLEGKIDIEVGTFSKAFGVIGGYAAGSKDLRNFLINRARSWLLSGSPAPAVVAACITAIDVLETEPQHVNRLWENTNYFKKELKSLGFDTGVSVTPITPVMVGDSHKAKALSDRLFELGVFGIPIVFPMVGRDKARIRTIVTAGLSRADLDEALRAFEKAGKELKVL